MALSVAVRDVKRLLADGSTDTSQGMAIVRADITLAASSDYGTVTTGTGAAAPGVPLIASTLGLGSTGAVLHVMGVAVRGSTSDSIPKACVPVYDAAKNSVRFFVDGSATSASNATSWAGGVPTEIVQSNVTAGDIVRVTLLGQYGN